MAFGKERFKDYVKQDNFLIAKLQKYESKLEHTVGRINRHKELRDRISIILEKKINTIADLTKQMEQLGKVEQTRVIARLRTQFLLYADFPKNSQKVDKVFFPEQAKKE